MDHDGVEWDSDPKKKADYRAEVEELKAEVVRIKEVVGRVFSWYIGDDSGALWEALLAMEDVDDE